MAGAKSALSARAPGGMVGPWPEPETAKEPSQRFIVAMPLDNLQPEENSNTPPYGYRKDPCARPCHPDGCHDCWGAESPARACFCGFCVPCVYSRAYERAHNDYEGSVCAPKICQADECPRTCLGCYLCWCMSTTQAGDANVPLLAAYLPTHNDAKVATCTTIASYLFVGCLPCVYFQPCQIASQLQRRSSSTKTAYL